MADYREMGRRDGLSGAPVGKCGLGPCLPEKAHDEYWEGYWEGRKQDPFGVHRNFR